MSKIAFTSIIIALIAAIILSSSVVANTFAKPSGGDSSGGSDGKVVEHRPGFNETFYNSTLPYCFAVQSGSCYDSSTGHIIT